MAPRDALDEPRGWSGPIEELGADERKVLVDSMAPTRPRIEIDEALQKGWFQIWYQPKIDLKRKCLAGAEALARICHPTLGVLLPGTFLPGVVEGSVARLTEFAVVSTLRDWSMFDEAGFNLSLSEHRPVAQRAHDGE